MIVIGVTVDGERDILGLWAGDGGQDAKFWLGVLTEIENRGVDDVCIVCIAVCDGLKGLPEAITTTWELATVQACVIHLIRNTMVRLPQRDEPGPATRLHSRLRGCSEGALGRARREVGQAVPGGQQAVGERLSELIPFLDYDEEIRRVTCQTNAIESINARYHRGLRAHGHSPTTRPR